MKKRERYGNECEIGDCRQRLVRRRSQKERMGCVAAVGSNEGRLSLLLLVPFWFSLLLRLLLLNAYCYLVVLYVVMVQFHANSIHNPVETSVLYYVGRAGRLG